MKLRFTVRKVREVFSHIEDNNIKFLNTVRNLWRVSGQILLGRVVKKYYTGRPGLKRKTGAAARAWKTTTHREGNDVVQKFFVDPSSPAKRYIMTHDKNRNFNGVINARRKPYLAFQINNKWKKVKSVFIPIRTDVYGFLNREGAKTRLRTLNEAVKVYNT